MSNTVFKLRRSSVAGKVPNTSTVAIGELAINLTDKILYSSDGSNVFEIGANNTNVNVSNTLTVKTISANSSTGVAGQVLASNGSSTYWFTPIGGVLPIQQQYVANGTQNTFSVTGGYIANSISVFLNGVMLRNGNGVNVTSGSTFTITPTPANGALIDVVGPSRLYSTGVNSIVSQQFTANGSANSFAITGGYIANSVLVFLNGVKQIPGSDVDITSGANVGFYSTPANGFIIDVYGYQTMVALGSNTITVGSNLTIGTDNINIGNSTVNTQITASGLTTTGNVNIGATGELIISAGAGIFANGAGITVESPNAQFYYSSSANSWQSTHSFIVGGGAQSTRPTGSNGMIRYNTNTGMTEIYSATGWGTVQVSSIDYGFITDSVITSLDFGGV